MKITDEIINMTFEEALAAVYKKGYTIRVAEEDGFCFMQSMDFDLNRVNVSLVKNRVVSATTG